MSGKSKDCFTEEIENKEQYFNFNLKGKNRTNVCLVYSTPVFVQLVKFSTKKRPKCGAHCQQT